MSKTIAFALGERQDRRFRLILGTSIDEGEMKRIAYLIIVLTAAIVANCQEDPVAWTAKGPATPIRAGQKFTAKLTASIAPGWHIYSITQPPGGPVATQITVPPKQPFSLSAYVIGPLPHSEYDDNFHMQTESYANTAVFKVPLIVDSKARVGANSIAIDVRFQVCNERQCLPAKTVHLTAAIKMTGSAARH